MIKPWIIGQEYLRGLYLSTRLRYCGDMNCSKLNIQGSKLKTRGHCYTLPFLCRCFHVLYMYKTSVSLFNALTLVSSWYLKNVPKSEWPEQESLAILWMQKRCKCSQMFKDKGTGIEHAKKATTIHEPFSTHTIVMKCTTANHLRLINMFTDVRRGSKRAKKEITIHESFYTDTSMKCTTSNHLQFKYFNTPLLNTWESRARHCEDCCEGLCFG